METFPPMSYWLPGTATSLSGPPAWSPETLRLQRSRSRFARCSTKRTQSSPTQLMKYTRGGPFFTSSIPHFTRSQHLSRTTKSRTAGGTSRTGLSTYVLVLLGSLQPDFDTRNR